MKKHRKTQNKQTFSEENGLPPQAAYLQGDKPGRRRTGPNRDKFLPFVCNFPKETVYYFEVVATRTGFSAVFQKMLNPCLTNKSEKRSILLCISLLVFAASLALRLLKLALDPGLMRDSSLYLAWADNWFQTGNHLHDILGDPTLTPPLAPWTIKTVMAYGFNADISGRAISLFLGSLMPVAGFLFALKLCGKIRIALLTTFLLVVHPDLVTYSVQPLRENVYLFFIGALLTMIVDAVHDNSAVKWGICGIPLSLAFFSRYETMEFFLIIPLIILTLFFLKRIKLKQVFLYSISLGLTFILTSVVFLYFIEFKCYFLSKLIYYWLDRIIS